MAHAKSIFEELAPFASMVVDQGRGVTVSDLAFTSAEDKWSTALIPLVLGALPANSSVRLFQKNVGETGQGFATNAMTGAETNVTNGDRQPANQVYVATHLGFHVYATSGTTSRDPLGIDSAEDLYRICANTWWTLKIGDGIERALGTVLEYPAGSGVDMRGLNKGATASASDERIATNGWAGRGKRKLPIPIIFPPNIQVNIGLKTGAVLASAGWRDGGDNGANQLNTTVAIAYRATFCGFRMTLPV